jgi:ribose 5-phosphate isomerase A
MGEGAGMSADDWKQQAAEKAMQYVEPGMKLGLGTGSTTAKFVDLVGAKVKAGLDVVCVPTSEATRAQAAALGIKLSSLDETPFLDLTVDGADEIDGELRLIKGGGGALLREKIVAVASQRVVIIADHTKRVETLGTFPLPVEVVQFGVKATRDMIESLAADCGCEGPITLRQSAGGKPFVTDNGNFILDCAFGAIEDPDALDDALKLIPGVVENGLFIGIADLGIIAGPMGVEVLSNDDPEFGGEV